MSITLFCHIFSDNPMPTLHVLCGRAPQTGGLETAEINALLLSTREVWGQVRSGKVLQGRGVTLYSAFPQCLSLRPGPPCDKILNYSYLKSFCHIKSQS